jgi:aryl-alcohol dehydrogenase-like predicted oxidoreductase
MVYSPQAGGFLLGKHRQFKAEMPEGGRYSDDFKAANFYKNTYWNQLTFDAMEQFISVTEKYNITPMSLALKWVRSNPAVSACIVGARTLEQMQQNLVAWEENVPDEAINEASAIGNQVWDTAPWKPQMHMTAPAVAKA